MEVTRELRKDKLNKKGLAPIQLTFYWEGKRLRLASGERCQPEHWNPKTSLVRDKPGAYAEQRNLVLQHWTEAGHNAHRDAAVRGQRLTAPQMEAEIRRRYLLLAGDTDKQPAPPRPTPARPTGPGPARYFAAVDRAPTEQGFTAQWQAAGKEDHQRPATHPPRAGGV